MLSSRPHQSNIWKKVVVSNDSTLSLSLSHTHTHTHTPRNRAIFIVSLQRFLEAHTQHTPTPREQSYLHNNYSEHYSAQYLLKVSQRRRCFPGSLVGSLCDSESAEQQRFFCSPLAGILFLALFD